MDFEFNPFRLLIPPGGEPIRSIQITSNLDWLDIPDPITGQNAIMPLSAKTNVFALKVFATGTAPGTPSMRSLSQGHIPNLEISQINGLQAALNALVRTIASGHASLSITNNGVGDYLVTPNFGTTSTTFAIGNDTRFPASVSGLRKGAGNGSLDTAATQKVDYWGTSVFVPSGGSITVPAPDRRGLVPDPGASAGITRFLCEDGTWKTAGAGSVSSVGLALPASVFTVTGSPVTGTGTLTGTLALQSANLFFVGPATGPSAQPTFRAIAYLDVATIVGTIANKIAAGDDPRFPSAVIGLRKSAGAGITDVAAVKFTDYWDNTIFVSKGPSHKIGLVPDPGPGIPPFTRFLREDATWQDVVPTIVDNTNLAPMPPHTVKGNPNGITTTPLDITAKDARSSSLLNLESITTHGDSDYAILTTDKYVATSATLTGDRTWSLPLANLFNPGQTITVSDDFGGLTGSKINVQRSGADLIQGSSTGLVLTSKFASVTFASDGVNKWSVIGMRPSSIRKTFTANTTYNLPTGCKSIFVECISGGGGGAGAQASASNCSAGGGGGGGSYSASLIIAPASSYGVVIGAGGTGGTSANGAGGTGSDTTFGGTVIVAKGGGGGANAAGGGTTSAVAGFAGVSVTAGAAGDTTLAGSDGGYGARFSGTSGVSGSAGSSPISGTRRGVANNEAGGSNGYLYGTGGVGALSTSATGWVGGTGAQGVIYLTEYY